MNGKYELDITCPGPLKYNHSIQGSGIMEINPLCRVETDLWSFRPSEFLTISTNLSFNPEAAPIIIAMDGMDVTNWQIWGEILLEKDIYDVKDLESVQASLKELVVPTENGTDQEEIKQLLEQVDILVENARASESWFYELRKHFSKPYRVIMYVVILCLIIGIPLMTYCYCKYRKSQYARNFILGSNCLPEQKKGKAIRLPDFAWE